MWLWRGGVDGCGGLVCSNKIQKKALINLKDKKKHDHGKKMIEGHFFPLELLNTKN
jgi:hypothetical protein